MSFIELFLTGVALSMDAFAVSLCKGLSMKKLDLRVAAVTALFFGGFQALMPLLGWLLGRGLREYITTYDHWLAFALLTFIGGKMIIDALRGDREEYKKEDGGLRIAELLLLAVATSIDALAVGVTFAFLSVPIASAALTIGLTTLILSFAGVIAGNSFGTRVKDKAQIAGGIVLVAIGVKTLIEHILE